MDALYSRLALHHHVRRHVLERLLTSRRPTVKRTPLVVALLLQRSFSADATRGLKARALRVVVGDGGHVLNTA